MGHWITDQHAVNEILKKLAQGAPALCAGTCDRCEAQKRQVRVTIGSGSTMDLTGCILSSQEDGSFRITTQAINETVTGTTVAIKSAN